MNPLNGLTNVFIKTFGITEPTDRQRNVATAFICSLMLAVVVGLCALGYILLHILNTK